MKLAIFDWNGTLCNDRDITYFGVVKIFNYFQITPPSAKTYFREITADYMPFYYQHGIPETASTQKLNEIWTDHFKNHSVGPTLHKGATSLLFSLKRNWWRLAIVSAQTEALLSHQIKNLGLSDCFDFIRGDSKNKKIALAETLQQLEVKAEKTFYVDDNDKGIQDANGLGIHTIGFGGGWQSTKQIKAAKPKFFVDQLEKINSIAKQLE